MTSSPCFAILSNVVTRNNRFGGIAQLGERLTGSQEVSGSIPLISTKKKNTQSGVLFLFLQAFPFRKNYAILKMISGKEALP